MVKVETYVNTDGESPEFTVRADLHDHDLVWTEGGVVTGVGDTIDSASRRFWRNLKQHLKEQERKAS